MAQTTIPATVLVTGAARRLGRDIALHFAKAGWNVVIHYRNSRAEANDVLAAVEETGVRGALIHADLSEIEAAEHVIVESCAALGPLTCLVNNASQFNWDIIDNLSPALWQTHLDVNLRAPVFLTKAFAKALPASETGSVINVIDQQVWRLDPEFFSYTIAKSALWTATRTLAQTLAPRIRINAVAPGPVFQSHRQTSAEFEEECRGTLLGKGVYPEDICAAIRFLAETPSVTGQMIAVDCGQHLTRTALPLNRGDA
jgi:NAD(P)-dependent dehydrogenase (short-subunit alcohol dehydrogenase family)